MTKRVASALGAGLAALAVVSVASAATGADLPLIEYGDRDLLATT
jgi:hypothetical protein